MDTNKIYEKFPRLKKIPLYSKKQLNKHFASAPEWILDYFSVVKIPPNAFFVNENDPADTVYYVVDGLYKAIDYRIFGVEYVFAEFSKVYAMGGLEALLDFDTYIATLQAISECIAIKIPRSQFNKWLESDIVALRHESKMMGEYLLEQGQLAREYLFLPGPERLSKILIQRYERDAVNGVLKAALSRQDLSNETGFGIKTVSRSLKYLTDKGLITRNKRYIIVDYEQYLQMKGIIASIVRDSKD